MKTMRSCILLFALMLPMSVVQASGARLFVAPDSGVYQIGQTFDVQVMADTDRQLINAVEAELAYNPRDFAVEKISTDKSILTTWSTPASYDGASGIIKFSGWVGQKFNGPDGLLITITLRALRVTQSSVLFNSGAMLAADMQGGNIINNMSAGTYAISPKQIAPTPLSEDQVQATPEKPVVSPVTQGGQRTTATPDGLPANTTQAAAVVFSGFELAPEFIGFFALLAFMAFCIAYILHRRGVR